MIRRSLGVAGMAIAGLGAAQAAAAGGEPAPTAHAAGGGLTVSPSILETTARRGAARSATITNTSGRRLRVTVRTRPWRQSSRGAVAAASRGSMAGAGVRPRRFTLSPGARRSVRVRLGRVPSRRSSYGALVVVGTPTQRTRGINIRYRIVSSVRFNPRPRARRLRLATGDARISGRTLLLAVRNRGNTVDPVGGTVSITGPRFRASRVGEIRILPGKRVFVRLASLRGLRRGRYRAAVTLRQRGRNVASATRRFRIR